MIKNRTLAIATLGALCLLSSCNLDMPQQTQPPVWYSERPVEMINGTTGETETHTSVMALTFYNANMECLIERGIVDIIAYNRVAYEARWDNDKEFALFETYGPKDRGPRYKGMINGKKMTLNSLDEAGEIEDTRELEQR